MKKAFIGVTIRNEPHYEKIIALIDKISEKKIAILYSNQFVNVAEKISSITKKEVITKMQILGCSNPKFSKDVEAILIIGQGKFHTVSIAYESNLPTYVIEGESLWKVLDEDVEKMKKKEMGMILKYLNSEKVGVLITSKPGQMRFEKAIEYKKNLKDKKAYLFIANDLDTKEFENFGLDCWVNTACPRMDLTEGSIINLDKVPKN